MKKVIIIILLLNILIILFMGIKLSQAYSRTPTIYFDGIKKEISFINDNNTDLFTNLKEIMPGDIKEQDILFKLNNVRKDTKVFLEIDEDIEEELQKNISIKIFANNKELTKNGEYTELGTFSGNEEINLKVIVEVSKESSNEIENIKQNMKWKILIQENDNSDLIEVPYTYDNSNIILYVIICVVSLIVLICSIIVLRKINKKDKCV